MSFFGKYSSNVAGGGGGGPGSVAWGAITGTLSDQTDLQSALDAKVNASGGTLTAGTLATSVTCSYATASTVSVFDGTKNLVSSSVTTTELNLLSGKTSIGTVSGSTGATDTALLIASGTGGSTLQARTGITVDSNNTIDMGSTPASSSHKKIKFGSCYVGNENSSSTTLAMFATTFKYYDSSGNFIWSSDNTNMRQRAPADNNHYLGFNVPNSSTQTLQAADALNIAVNVNAGSVTAIQIPTTGVVGLPVNSDSAATTDLVTLSGYDLSAGNRTLSLGVETAVVTESVTSDATLAVRINGVTYKICLKT